MSIYGVIERVIWENCHSHVQRIGLSRDKIIDLAQAVETALIMELELIGGVIGVVNGRLECIELEIKSEER